MALDLWTIEADLRKMLDEREELELAPLAEGLTDDDRLKMLGELDLAIHAWVEREVRKVDNVRSAWKLCEWMIQAASEEAKLQRDRAKRWDARFTLLKGMLVSVMDANGLKKLEGRTGSLLLKGNGGKQAVLISDPALVPEEYCMITVKIDVPTWVEICKRMPPAEWMERRATVEESMPVPRLDAIRQALEKPCPDCAWSPILATPGRVEGIICKTCGGSGFNGVPGCQLEPRGQHCEIR